MMKTPFDVRKQMQDFLPYFNRFYLPVKARQQHHHLFTEAEDQLLCLGMQRYGYEAFDAIRELLLPTKSKAMMDARDARAMKRPRDGQQREDPVRPLASNPKCGNAARLWAMLVHGPNMATPPSLWRSASCSCTVHIW